MHKAHHNLDEKNFLRSHYVSKSVWCKVATATNYNSLVSVSTIFPSADSLNVGDVMLLAIVTVNSGLITLNGGIGTWAVSAINWRRWPL
jgi:hypothetical protein